MNSTYPGYAKAGSVVVRTEEALIVTLVLLLWVAAIALFFNRWGKIRMLEPYQPKFEQEHRGSCAIIDTNTLPLRTCSKFNIHCVDHSLCVSASTMNRPRQNSVFVDSSMSLLPSYNDRNVPRRSKSAFDLQSIVMSGGGDCNVKGKINNLSPLQRLTHDSALEEEENNDALSSTTNNNINNNSNNNNNNSNNVQKPAFRSFQRERGMSICQFDRNDIPQQLIRPLQRERGMSICHFDRMDVLARPIMQRDRGMSICHFDRMDVLARPMMPSALCRGSRASIFSNNLDKNELSSLGITRTGYQYQRGSRSSVGNVEASTRFLQHRIKDRAESLGAKNISTVTGHRANQNQNVQSLINNTTFYGPSCSKSSDLVLGNNNATCL